MKLGLSKYAQGEQEEELAGPEDTKGGGEELVTCLSDCIYAQNPEKTCMLKNIALKMSAPGKFECGQYQKVQEMVPADQAAMGGIAAARQKENQEQAAPAPATKSEAPAAAKPKPAK